MVGIQAFGGHEAVSRLESSSWSTMARERVFGVSFLLELVVPCLVVPSYLRGRYTSQSVQRWEMCWSQCSSDCSACELWVDRLGMT